MSKHDFIKRNVSGTRAILGLVALVIAFVIGVDAYIFNQINNNPNQPDASRQTDQTSSSLQASLPVDLLTIEQVKALATQEISSTPVASIELEKENNTHLYKVTFADGTLVVFNAQTGDKINLVTPQVQPQTTTLPQDFTANIDFKKAREIAQAQNPNGLIKKIELQKEAALVIFSVRFKDGSRIDINASDGSIIRTEPAKQQGKQASPKDSDAEKTSKTASQ